MSSETPAAVENITQHYAHDGVIYIPKALSATTMSKALEAYEWSLEQPGPGASELPSKGDGVFYQDLANPAAFSAYSALLDCVDLRHWITEIFGQAEAWFMYEQVFKKSGGSTRRTPWHQDSSYLPVAGRDLAVMWISFDPVAAEQALEFVRGSHQTTLYDGSRFDPTDDTLPLYGDGSLPKLPDIESERANWDIVSWATSPGDVVIFHPAILHGGGDTTLQTPRRTLSLRFFGADAVVAARPGRRQVENQSLKSANEHPR